MKILHISTNDIVGGAGIFSRRLVKEQRNQEVESNLLVRNKISNLNYVKQLKTFKLKHKIFKKLKYLFSKMLLREFSTHFSTGLFSDIKKETIVECKTDIIHLHWFLNSFLSLNTLKNTNKPIVLTLHDSWALTGGCHLPIRCDKFSKNCSFCPLFKHNLSMFFCEYLWRIKKRFFEEVTLHIVCPSNWIYNLAKNSSITKNSFLYHIQNGIDRNIYFPKTDIEKKSLFRFDPNKKKIAIGAFNLSLDKNKGFDLVIKILSQFSKLNSTNEYLIIFYGDIKISNYIESIKFECKVYDTIYDEYIISDLYNSIDLLILPSRLENLSNSIAESLSCGTPVVTFDVGGNSELITHNENGYLVDPYNVEDFSEGMTNILERFTNCHRYSLINEKFDIKFVTKKYISLYKNILE